MPADELYPDNLWDIEEVLVVQDPISVFSALLAKLFIGPEFLSLLVFILEFLQLQFHTMNSGCIRPFLPIQFGITPKTPSTGVTRIFHR